MTKKQAGDILNAMRGENLGYDNVDRFEALTMGMEALEGKNPFTRERAVEMIEEIQADIIEGMEGSSTAGLVRAALGLIKCRIAIDEGEAREH